jgi:SagB-type dehydrogenase family enzyme
MRILTTFCILIGTLFLLMGTTTADTDKKVIKLPAPSFKGNMSVEEAIYKRKTARSFGKKPLNLKEVSQLLWVANGTIPKDAVTGATSKVTPSAGGLYPLEAFLVVGKGGVEDVPAGVYQYVPRTNSMKLLVEGDKRNSVATAALYQGFLALAPVNVIVGAVFERTTIKYGGRGHQYVFMEAGSSNQNICLQAEALGLRVATVGAFEEKPLSKALKLPNSVRPIVIMGIGHKPSK